jgi:hypothetical protein
VAEQIGDGFNVYASHSPGSVAGMYAHTLDASGFDGASLG